MKEVKGFEGFECSWRDGYMFSERFLDFGCRWMWGTWRELCRCCFWCRSAELISGQGGFLSIFFILTVYLYLNVCEYSNIMY